MRGTEAFSPLGRVPARSSITPALRAQATLRPDANHFAANGSNDGKNDDPDLGKIS